MKKLTLSDFSGGIQEASGPGDFTKRQWAQLKGIVPESEVSFVSQWPCQQIGTTSGFKAVYALPSPLGTFLVGIKGPSEMDAGTIWWCKAPASSALYTAADDVVWTQITTAENVGVKVGDNDAVDQPTITITANPDFRFLCAVPFEVYKYNVNPTDGTATNFSTDTVDAGSPKATVSGVLIHSRRYSTGTGSYTAVANQMAVVAYVDPYADSGAGQVKACTFPNWRRMPQTAAGAFLGVQDNTGSTTLFNGYGLGSRTGVPGTGNDFHPYTYLDANGTLLPGRGTIPRANVGVSWGGLLILGDVEWRSDKATTAVVVGDNTAYFSLSDSITAPYRSYIYYSEDDIDTWDPRSVLRAGSSDTTVVGLHVLDNTLVAITTSGGEGDGVISFRGQLSQLHPYSGTPDPFAVRREIIRGGLGGVTPDETVLGHRSVSCVWAEAGVVVFLDRLGGIWYTDGDKCDRLDRFGPTPPAAAGLNDHVAAVGRHLFAWRNNRLLVFTLLTSSGSEASGCWTEFVAPEAGVYSMVGCGEELFFVSGGVVHRYTPNGPTAERGKINGTAVDITVSTATVGEEDEHAAKNWHRFGMTFETPTGAEVRTVRVQASGALTQSTSPATYTLTLNRNYAAGYRDFVVPAGIGQHPIASATVTFRGYIRLQEAAFWTTGEEPKR
jgi:hypothetical protein